jgi:hypothetical protein
LDHLRVFGIRSVGFDVDDAEGHGFSHPGLQGCVPTIMTLSSDSGCR